MTSTYVVPDNRCPACNAQLTRASGPDETHGPKPGDLSICLECGIPLTFNEAMALERVPDTILQALAPEDQAALAEAQRHATLYRLIKRKGLSVLDAEARLQ